MVFWCVESCYERVNGVVEVVRYAGGNRKRNPTYEQVSPQEELLMRKREVIIDPT